MDIINKRICEANGCNETKELHLHHIIPRSLFPKEYEKGKKYDLVRINERLLSNRIFLCGKHHNMISNILIKKIFNLFSQDKKEYVMNVIYTFTKKEFCKKKDDTNTYAIKKQSL
ncbi:hypothetical protein LCGC14_0534760 [marine sediment metagenome]|uniref:Uncharacterized protein n=1 Tax=marine sediment metagenome TaxID=412755 RepID=A0A0F9RUN9_9ZZZZ